MDFRIDNLSSETNRLFIRLDAKPDAAVHWWLEGEVRQYGELESVAELAQLPPAAIQGRVYIVVPAKYFLFRRLAFPGALNAKAQQALKYMLEPFALTDPDKLHTQVISRDERSVLLAAIDRELMVQWCQQLADAGIHPDALYPDAHLIAQGSAMCWQSSWIVHHEGQGYYLDKTWIAPENTAIPTPDDQWLSPCIEDTAVLWQQTLDCSSPVNWLQGEFKTRKRNTVRTCGVPRSWLYGGVALMLIFAGLQITVNGWQQYRLAQSLHSQTVSLYQQMFAVDKAPENIRRGARARIANLQLLQSPNNYLQALQKLEPAFDKTPDIELTDMDYQQKNARLTLSWRSKNNQQEKALINRLSHSVTVTHADCQRGNHPEAGRECKIVLDIS